MSRNSFEGLRNYVEEEVDPLTPPAIDLVARYKDAPQTLTSVFDGAGELEEATPKALRTLSRILDFDVDFDDINRMRAQISAARRTRSSCSIPPRPCTAGMARRGFEPIPQEELTWARF